jgi:prepilin-type N-terminal cleavage/methylation domain-containing protein
MLSTKRSAGVTLVELMITLAIIGVLSAVAIPIYSDYIVTARLGVMGDNINSIRLFEESYKLEYGGYLGGVYDPVNNPAASPLIMPFKGPPSAPSPGLGWSPGTGQDVIKYEVVVSGDSFTVTATHLEFADTVVTKTF